MRPGLILLALTLLPITSRSQESCENRCENGFDAQKTCQCDTMCRYYQSCCADYETACRMHIRGDTFVFAEDDDEQMSPTKATGRGRPHGRLSMPSTTAMTATDAGTRAGSTADMKPSPSITTHPEGPKVVTPSKTDVPNTTNVPGSTEVPDSADAPRTTDFSSITAAPVTADVSGITNVPSAMVTPITADVLHTTDVPSASVEPITVDVLSTTDAPSASVKPTTTDVSHTTDVQSATVMPITTDPTPTQPPDPDADACSGRPFDAFLQLKNGTIFAFRGIYFFGLDDKSVLPGYPRLIKDVWGISGPIDAAFTRINCQGKTYFFKGNKYWRFEDEVLDEDYPRDISVGFEKVPDNLHAAFSAPAHGHHGKEKVYFFKGDQYFQYEFKHQPTHEECIQMSLRSPSMPFLHYTNMYYQSWEEFYNILFGGLPGHHHGPHFINKDWKGLKAPIDAVMAGRLYVIPRPPPRQDQNRNNQQQWDQGWGQPWSSRRRQNRSPQWPGSSQWGVNIGREFAERGMNIGREFAERGMNIGREFMGSRSHDDRMRDLEDRWRDEQDRRRDEEDRLRDRWRDESRRRHDYDYRFDSRDDFLLDMVRKSQPVQSVYFFKGDKYYRVDLQSKRVDPASPPYPRSIGKYWLGCKEKPGAERK
ncbi:vitronectin a [Sardina pilchardus]|uniref:vitronectin a n=1 Tax=Sardina pilchardus TaxID=27697 RepID=UPI002E130725